MAASASFAPTAGAVLQELDVDWLRHHGVRLAVLRLDLVDPELSGNKWFKLVHHLEAAQKSAAPGLISLGGPHSNHLHALAAAGQRFGLQTVGLLRGVAQDTPTVRDLQRFGMQLHWLGFGGYRARHQPDFWQPWLQRYGGFHPVPEGGGGLAGALGCVPLVKQLQTQLSTIGWAEYDALWLAVGTGTTLAGLVIGETGRHPVVGALAGPPEHAVPANLQRLLAEAGMPDSGYRLVEACRAGFGRFDAQLARFMRCVEQEAGIPFEPVYTAKALLALRSRIEAGDYAAGSRIVFIHTGGLQGRRAAEEQLQRLRD